VNLEIELRCTTHDTVLESYTRLIAGSDKLELLVSACEECLIDAAAEEQN
jgi:hypothetical protein